MHEDVFAGPALQRVSLEGSSVQGTSCRNMLCTACNQVSYLKCSTFEIQTLGTQVANNRYFTLLQVLAVVIQVPLDRGALTPDEKTSELEEIILVFFFEIL